MVANLLNNLGGLYRSQDRYSEAEAFYKRGLTIGEKAINDKVWGPDEPFVATALSNLAALALAQSDWTLAADYWRRSTGILKRRVERGLVEGRGEGTGGDSQRRRWVFRGLIKASYRAEGRRRSRQLSAEMFETAQWAHSSEAAASLAQMAARSAGGSPELAGLVRERQDLLGEWQVKDKLLTAAKSREPAQRNADAEKVLSDRLATIDARVGEIDQRCTREFPKRGERTRYLMAGSLPCRHGAAGGSPRSRLCAALGDRAPRRNPWRASATLCSRVFPMTPMTQMRRATRAQASAARMCPGSGWRPTPARRAAWRASRRAAASSTRRNAMTRTMLSSLAAAVIVAMAAGGAVPADAGKGKRKAATSTGGASASRLKVEFEDVLVSHVRGTKKGTAQRRK
jgi:hypothetical protein